VFLWWVFVWNIALFLKTIVDSNKNWIEDLFSDFKEENQILIKAIP
jgi:hypothetical protein